jgi:CheY-like chemotaxis protein
MIAKVALVIEDRQIHRRMLSRYLKQKGYEIIQAEDGEEGFKKFCEFSPQLTFIDIVLPGQSGFEVLNSIRLIDPSAKLVVMSAYMTDKRIRRAVQENVDWLLLKPFRKAELLAILDRYED